MSSSEIPRIAAPAPAEFLEEHVFSARPAVITGLFQGQPVDQIRTLEDALREWPTVQIAVQEEYARVGAATATEPGVMSLRDYIALTSADPTTRLCCTEYDTPVRILASIRLPDICATVFDRRDEIFDLPKKYGDLDLVTNTFVANAGNVAHLHFDGDQRQVLLHQVYGRKRVVLLPPAAAVHLRTLDGPHQRPSLAGVYLEHMNQDEQRELLECCGGQETVLEPGDTLYIPMLMWHYVEYLDDAMSFNLRFGRTAFGRFLSLDNFHRDPFIQNVAAKMIGPADRLAGFEPAIDRVRECYVAPAADVHDRVRRMRALFRDLCAEHAPEASPERLCPPEREEEQVARIAASRDMAGGMKYAPPAVLAKTRRHLVAAGGDHHRPAA
jgi:hypothetical protein